MNGHRFPAESVGKGNRRRRGGRWSWTGRSARIAGIDRVTAVLAAITCLLLGAGVADMSHAVVPAITAAAAITAGLVVTLAVLRPSS